MIFLLAALQVLIHLIGTLGDVAAGLALLYTLVIRLHALALRLRRSPQPAKTQTDTPPD
jgi:hypothetical protein